MTGTLQHLDPTILLIGENVRDNAALDSQFVASVREHGVLQPITAVRTDTGIEVRDGQRRTLAAREAKLNTIPVYVLDGQAADDKTATAERIAHQIVTNDQRSALTDAQRVKGITQMLLAGISPAKVAKKLAVDRDTVTAAASVADSPAALTALEDGQLSLAEAAAMREFEDDEHAVDSLLAMAGTGAFDHRVAQLRQDRIAEQARAKAETTYQQQGFMILTERPAWRDTSVVLLRHLRTPDSHEATQAAVTDPAHWAVLMVEESVLVDTVTGEPVDEADVDWSTEHRPEQQPDEGARHADTVMDKTVWAPEYYCRDPQACALTLADFLTRAEPIVHGHGEQNDAETAEARAEAQRTERRKVLALNKLGVAAQEVRRTWVRDHLLARLVDCTSRIPICCRTRGVDVFGRRSSCSMRWRRHETYLSCSCR
jgi:ParB family chromosome partitioning protein